MTARPAVALLVLLAALGGCQTPTAPPVTEASTGEPIRSGVHVVARGDTLYSIAFRYGWDFKALARRNAIRPPYTIHPGQRIRLDAPRAASAAPATARAPARTPPAATPTAPARTTPQPAPPTARSTPREAGPPASWRWPLASGGAGAEAAGNGLRMPTSGRQPVLAAAPGTVVYAGDGLRAFGLLVIVRHGGDYLSAYGHLGRIRVKEGEVVKAGAVLADTDPDGSGPGTGLHFEIRRQGRPVDPRTLLK